MNRILPEGVSAGPMQSRGVVGDVTEGIHRFLLDGWESDEPPPRLEEDLSFVPKDREQVLYVYMYRTAENTALKNPKQFRPVPFSIPGDNEEAPPDGVVYYEWPPLYLEIYYLLAVHSKFRSDAERLLGWVMMRLHQATHLIYRPRKYILPDGRVVDSTGQDWDPERREEGVIIEKVALSLVDDLSVGDAINFFTIHEAPFRPYLTYRALCAMRGPLVASTGTTVRSQQVEPMEGERPRARPSGRLGRVPLRHTPRKPPFGPPGHGVSPLKENNEDSEG